MTSTWSWAAVTSAAGRVGDLTESDWRTHICGQPVVKADGN